MAKVIQLQVTPTPPKLGYKRASKRKDLEKKGQLNLFRQSEPQIHRLPSRFTPFEQALLLDEEGNPSAQEAYLKAILENDSVADACCNLGILESHYNLANLYFEVNDYRLAKLHYEVAAEIEPDFPNIYFNLALVYALNEEYKDAVNALFKYKELVPEDEGKKADNLLTGLQRTLKDG